MGTITTNKLGGLALTFGPLLAVLAYLATPGQGLIGGQVDWSNAQAAIGTILENATLSTITGFLAPIGLIILLFGLNTLVSHLEKGEGAALAGLGRVFFVFALVCWLVGSSFVVTIAGGNAGPAVGALYAGSFGLQLAGGILSGVAFLLVGLGVSANADFNKNFALVVALVSAVLLVVNLIIANDPSMQLSLSPIIGVGFIVFTVWSVTLGQKLNKIE
jgi:hypothetical protein